MGDSTSDLSWARELSNLGVYTLPQAGFDPKILADVLLRLRKEDAQNVVLFDGGFSVLDDRAVTQDPPSFYGCAIGLHHFSLGESHQLAGRRPLSLNIRVREGRHAEVIASLEGKVLASSQKSLVPDPLHRHPLAKHYFAMPSVGAQDVRSFNGAALLTPKKGLMRLGRPFAVNDDLSHVFAFFHAGETHFFDTEGTPLAAFQLPETPEEETPLLFYRSKPRESELRVGFSNLQGTQPLVFSDQQTLGFGEHTRLQSSELHGGLRFLGSSTVAEGTDKANLLLRGSGEVTSKIERSTNGEGCTRIMVERQMLYCGGLPSEAIGKTVRVSYNIRGFRRADLAFELDGQEYGRPFRLKKARGFIAKEDKKGGSDHQVLGMRRLDPQGKTRLLGKNYQLGLGRGGEAITFLRSRNPWGQTNTVVSDLEGKVLLVDYLEPLPKSAAVRRALGDASEVTFQQARGEARENLFALWMAQPEHFRHPKLVPFYGPLTVRGGKSLSLWDESLHPVKVQSKAKSAEILGRTLLMHDEGVEAMHTFPYGLVTHGMALLKEDTRWIALLNVDPEKEPWTLQGLSPTFQVSGNLAKSVTFDQPDRAALVIEHGPDQTDKYCLVRKGDHVLRVDLEGRHVGGVSPFAVATAPVDVGGSLTLAEIVSGMQENGLVDGENIFDILFRMGLKYSRSQHQAEEAQQSVALSLYQASLRDPDRRIDNPIPYLSAAVRYTVLKLHGRSMIQIVEDEGDSYFWTNLKGRELSPDSAAENNEFQRLMEDALGGLELHPRRLQWLVGDAEIEEYPRIIRDAKRGLDQLSGLQHRLLVRYLRGQLQKDMAAEEGMLLSQINTALFAAKASLSDSLSHHSCAYGLRDLMSHSRGYLPNPKFFDRTTNTRYDPIKRAIENGGSLDQLYKEMADAKFGPGADRKLEMLAGMTGNDRRILLPKRKTPLEQHLEVLDSLVETAPLSDSQRRTLQESFEGRDVDSTELRTAEVKVLLEAIRHNRPAFEKGGERVTAQTKRILDQGKKLPWDRYARLRLRTCLERDFGYEIDSNSRPTFNSLSSRVKHWVARFFDGNFPEVIKFAYPDIVFDKVLYSNSKWEGGISQVFDSVGDMFTRKGSWYLSSHDLKDQGCFGGHFGVRNPSSHLLNKRFVHERVLPKLDSPGDYVSNRKLLCLIFDVPCKPVPPNRIEGELGPVHLNRQELYEAAELTEEEVEVWDARIEEWDWRGTVPVQALQARFGKTPKMLRREYRDTRQRLDRAFGILYRPQQSAIPNRIKAGNIDLPKIV